MMDVKDYCLKIANKVDLIESVIKLSRMLISHDLIVRGAVYVVLY